MPLPGVGGRQPVGQPGGEGSSEPAAPDPAAQPQPLPHRDARGGEDEARHYRVRMGLVQPGVGEQPGGAVKVSITARPNATVPSASAVLGRRLTSRTAAYARARVIAASRPACPPAPSCFQTTAVKTSPATTSRPAPSVRSTACEPRPGVGGAVAGLAVAPVAPVRSRRSRRMRRSPARSRSAGRSTGRGPRPRRRSVAGPRRAAPRGTQPPGRSRRRPGGRSGRPPCPPRPEVPMVPRTSGSRSWWSPHRCRQLRIPS